MKQAVQLTLRPVVLADAQMLLNWRNDPVAREYALRSRREIGLEEHRAWLTKALDSSDRILRIIEDAPGHPVGQVRVDIADGIGEVSIGLAPEARGKGYAAAALGLMCDEVLKTGRVRSFLARIRKDHAASIKAFVIAGFQRVGTEEHEGHIFEHYVRA